MPQKEYSSIYCLKLLGAFLIVCIHTLGNDFWNDSYYAVFPYLRTAVPIFFMISGFFLYNGNHERAIEKCKKTLIKICWITLYANIFYVIYDRPDSISASAIFDFIFLGNNNAAHLWYLNAYIETLLMIILFLKIRKLKLLWSLIPVLVIFGMLCGSYEKVTGLLPYNFNLSRNFATVGIPCVGLGWILRKYHDKIIYVLRYPLIWITITAILAEIEVQILRPVSIETATYGDIYIFTLPLSFIMLATAFKYPYWGENSLWAKLGKQYSLYIYIFHFAILQMCMIFCDRYFSLPLWAIACIVFVVTILFSVIWQISSNKFFVRSSL